MSEWLLMKRGLYERPDHCGYTGIRDHAGRYSETEATECAQNGVTMVKLADAPEFTDACFDDLALAHLTKQRDEARAALRLAADYIKDLDGGDQHSETGWKSEELLGVWLQAQAALPAGKCSPQTEKQT